MLLIASKWQGRARSCNPSRATYRHPESATKLQVRAEINRNNFTVTLSVALDDVEILECSQSPSAFALAQSFCRVATTLHMKVLHCLKHDAPHSQKVRQETFSDLLQSMQYALKALSLYRSTGGAEALVACTNHTWLLIEDLRTIDKSIAENLMKEFLIEIRRTERFCDETRRCATS